MAAAGALAAANAQHYEVTIDFRREVPGSTQKFKLVVPLKAGELGHLLPNPKMPMDCKIDLEVRALPNDQALFRMPFKCSDDNEQREPKLQVSLGQTAKVEIGKDMPGVKFEYSFDVTINRWPESKPWPESKLTPQS